MVAGYIRLPTVYMALVLRCHQYCCSSHLSGWCLLLVSKDADFCTKRCQRQKGLPVPVLAKADTGTKYCCASMHQSLSLETEANPSPPFSSWRKVRRPRAPSGAPLSLRSLPPSTRWHARCAAAQRAGRAWDRQRPALHRCAATTSACYQPSTGGSCSEAPCANGSCENPNVQKRRRLQTHRVEPLSLPSDRKFGRWVGSFDAGQNRAI